MKKTRPLNCSPMERSEIRAAAASGLSYPGLRFAPSGYGCGRDDGLIGIGGASQLLPSHTTVRTGPYTAVRWIKRQELSVATVVSDISNRRTGFDSSDQRQSGFHPFRVPRPVARNSVAWPIRYHCITRHFQRSGLQRKLVPPTMPSADFCTAVRSPATTSVSLRDAAQISRGKTDAFAARPPDLPPGRLMTMDFAISCSLVRPGRPRYPVFVHRPRLCSTLPSDPPRDDALALR